MSFNQYSVYSVISLTQGQNADDMQKILDITEKMKQLRSTRQAKEFVKTEFNITESISRFPIGNNAYITVRDTEKWYAINLQYDNQNLMYTFGK